MNGLVDTALMVFMFSVTLGAVVGLPPLELVVAGVSAVVLWVAMVLSIGLIGVLTSQLISRLKEAGA